MGTNPDGKTKSATYDPLNVKMATSSREFEFEVNNPASADEVWNALEARLSGKAPGTHQSSFYNSFSGDEFKKAYTNAYVVHMKDPNLRSLIGNNILRVDAIRGKSLENGDGVHMAELIVS